MTTDKLLVVDDDPAIINVFRLALEDRRVTADYCTSPMEALGTFVPGRYKLAVLDLVMPVINGLDLAKQLMARDPGLLIVLYTGLSTPVEETVMVISKTRPISEVADMVARMLKQEAVA